jgi:translation initiation factor IF-1
MVKNVSGGSSHKKFGRKFSALNIKAGHKLRVSEDEGELYCVVTKNLGNNMFHCCSTGRVTYLGHIRGKFTGRGRRDNTITTGVWVLIGLREWDNKDVATKGTKVKLQQCDLLEVYNDSDKQRLKETVHEEWDVLVANDPTKLSSDQKKVEDEFTFQTEKDLERERLIKELNSGTSKKISLVNEQDGEPNVSIVEEDEINIDDI